MKRESRAVWAERVGKWKASGLSARIFSAQEGIHPKSLSYWKWRLGSETQNGRGRRRSRSRGFVEVVHGGMIQGAEENVLEVVLEGGQRIRVPSGFDGETLRRLIQELQGRDDAR